MYTEKFHLANPKINVPIIDNSFYVQGGGSFTHCVLSNEADKKDYFQNQNSFVFYTHKNYSDFENGKHLFSQFQWLEHHTTLDLNRYTSINSLKKWVSKMIDNWHEYKKKSNDDINLAFFKFMKTKGIV